MWLTDRLVSIQSWLLALVMVNQALSSTTKHLGVLESQWQDSINFFLTPGINFLLYMSGEHIHKSKSQT